MCYNGKCLHCLEVETGTQIFAIIQLIFSSIATLAILYCIAMFNFQPFSQDSITWVNPLLGVSLALSFLALAFSFVLLDGVWHRKAGHVKAYFIYGLINLLVQSIFGLIGLIIHFDAGVLFIFFAFCTISGFLLHMIQMTYRKFQAESSSNTNNAYNIVA